MQFGVDCMKTKFSKLFSFHLYICCPFHFLSRTLLLPTFIFPARMFKLTLILVNSHPQCEGLSQAFPQWVSPQPCPCLFLRPQPSLVLTVLWEAFLQTHSLRPWRNTRVCPQGSEELFRQGKGTTPLVIGDFGRWNYFIPKRIESVS